MAKVLTYNLWHGLSPEGVLRFREMEPKTRKQLRYHLQSEMLRKLADCDLCFLQEVNPVELRSKELAQALGMEPYFCRDNSGIKWGPWGLPANLDSGLCTLVSERQYVEGHRVVRLSEGRHTYLSSKASFQLSESRSALFVSTFSDESGRSLWVNTHLHHGIEMSEMIRSQIAELRKSGEISEGVEEELLLRLQAADERRHLEVEVLLREIESEKSRYNLIVLAGDLNVTPESESFQRLSEYGFEILETQKTADTPLVTWDPVRNQANHILSKEYIPALLLEDLSFDKKTVLHLEELARSWEYRPRKIDYILGWSPSGDIHVKHSELLGLPESHNLAPSDHFGVLSEFGWSPGPGL